MPEFTGDPGPSQESSRRAATDIAPKIQAAGVGGATSVILIAIAQQLGVELSAEVAAAIVLVFTWASGYLKKG